MKIAIKEDVDGVVPLIGIDGPLIEVAIMKEKLEGRLWNSCCMHLQFHAASTCVDKYKTKEFFVKNNIKTPDYL